MMGEDLGRRAPKEAILQLARRPLMITVGSSQAFFAASASLNVTNPYPLDLPVTLSEIMTASRMSPYFSKCSLNVSFGVSQARPPTNTFVNVVSPNCDGDPLLLLLPIIVMININL